ncbi:MAG: hypothetical protein SGARI_003044 [Bacillariaceae sp.]
MAGMAPSPAAGAYGNQNNNNAALAPALAAVAAVENQGNVNGTNEMGVDNINNNNNHHTTFCSNDPAAAALAVTQGAALVGRIVASEMMSGGDNAKKKRLCRFPGCTKVIKSQGHCQRHGAKAKRCKVKGCDKQAQGTHEGMCKRHWRAQNFPEQPMRAERGDPNAPIQASAAATAAAAIAGLDPAAKQKQGPPPPEGKSVYATTLPASIAYRPPQNVGSSSISSGATGLSNSANGGDKKPAANGNGTSSAIVGIMPLVAHLREGAQNKPVGWHRNEERRARGLWPVTSLSTQLEPWERQLALVEILLLSGGTPHANFKDLAHGWGREKGFHNVLASSVCERRGEVERKRRSDAGKIMTAEARESFKAKLKKTKIYKTQTSEAELAAEQAPTAPYDVDAQQLQQQQALDAVAAAPPAGTAESEMYV